MPLFLCIELGNATKAALQENSQGVWVKGITAASADAAIDAYAAEQGRPGRYLAVSGGSIAAKIVGSPPGVQPEP